MALQCAMALQCVVPENIHTFPTGEIFSKDPLQSPIMPEIPIKLDTFL